MTEPSYDIMNRMWPLDTCVTSQFLRIPLQKFRFSSEKRLYGGSVWFFDKFPARLDENSAKNSCTSGENQLPLVVSPVVFRWMQKKFYYLYQKFFFSSSSRSFLAPSHLIPCFFHKFLFIHFTISSQFPVSVINDFPAASISLLPVPSKFLPNSVLQNFLWIAYGSYIIFIWRVIIV